MRAAPTSKSSPRPETPEGPSKTRTRGARLWRWFFSHLYTTLAWAYDAVAWLSSFGRWPSWRRTGFRWIVPGRRLLEVGCGTGHVLVESLARGDQTIAVDASPQMARITMRRLRRRGRPAVVARAQARDLPFTGGFFHAALSTFPSEYIFDPDALAELHRILAPGGALIVVFSARILPVFLWDWLSRWVYDLAGQAPRPDPSWLAPFEAAGFSARFETVEIPGASVFHIVATA